MEAIVKVNNNLSIKSSKETIDELFKEIALVQSTFEDTNCGKCKSSNIRYVVREAEGFEFFEMHCKDCRARLSFGHSKEDKKLYAKRCETETTGKNKGKAKRGEDGKAIWLENNGWSVYVPEEK